MVNIITINNIIKRFLDLIVLFKNRDIFEIWGYMQMKQKQQGLRHLSGNQPTRNTQISGTHVKLTCFQLKPAAQEDARVCNQRIHIAVFWHYAAKPRRSRLIKICVSFPFPLHVYKTVYSHHLKEILTI